MGLSRKRLLLLLVLCFTVVSSAVAWSFLKWYHYEKQFEVVPNVVAEIVLSDEKPVFNSTVTVEIYAWIEGASEGYVALKLTCYWYNSSSREWEQQWYVEYPDLSQSSVTWITVTTTPQLIFTKQFTVDKLGQWKIELDIGLYDYKK